MAARMSWLIALLTLFVANGVAQSPKVSSVLDMSEFVHDWQISKQFTLEVANAMPAEYYTFKPNADEMSFGEQMIHIAGANVFRFNQITGIKPPFEFNPPSPRPRTRTLCSSCLRSPLTT